MPHPFADFILARRTALIAGIYASIISAAFYLAYEVRFDFVVPEMYQQDRLRMLWLVVAVKLIALFLFRQVGSMMTYFSIPDLLRLVWAMILSSTVLLIPRMLSVEGFSPPRGVLLSDFMLCFGGLCLGRLATRMYRERLNPARKAAPGVQLQRIAIIGAGDAGASLAKDSSPRLHAASGRSCSSTTIPKNTASSCTACRSSVAPS